MAASTSTSLHGHGETALSPSTASSIAGTSSTLFAPSTSTTAHSSLSGTDYLRDLFGKRISSLVHLKRSLQGQRSWFSTIQLSPSELASAFENDRLHKRTLRYSLLGLSLSSILEISNPSDMARAIVSLVNELDSYTDDNILSLTSGAGAANFGTQKPRMRSFFKTGKSTIKRNAAAQAISEFGTLDSSVGPAASLMTAANEQASYMMAPNIPFQLDFFQTFLTLCDMLTEIYYKMLSFLPKDSIADAGARAPSPPHSALRHSQEYDRDRAGSIGQAAVDAHGEGSSAGPVISSVTQELLLKADAKIKKTINAQVKDIDVLARQMIKDELSSLDPLMKDLGLDSASVNSAFASSVAPSTKSGSSIGSGLPDSSTSSLPFGFSASSDASGSTAHSTAPSSTGASGSHFRTADKLGASLPSHFRRQPKSDTRTSPDSVTGHHQFNLASIGLNKGNGAEANTGTSGGLDSDPNAATGGIGSMMRSRSGKLRRMMSHDRPSSSEGVLPPSQGAGSNAATPTSESSLPVSSPTEA